MRDYSFGNFISTLREERGLSQYQLGTLVGVSDKAVSKWENGASKPRINTMKKLAQVLNVSVDELLTCEYAASYEDRKDLFAMKNDIIKQAENRLNILYGNKIPINILNRFRIERLMLENNDYLLWMDFYGKLQEYLYKEDIYMELREPQTEASFIAWLLGGTNINPLPAHYYCPHCKSIEFVPEESFGMDLPDKLCSCGRKYLKDGYNIDVMNMYPFNKWHEIRVPMQGMNYVTDCLKEYFNNACLLHEIEIQDETIEFTGNNCEARQSSFIIMPYEINKQFKDNKTIISYDEFFNISHELSGITIVENTKENIGNITDITMDFSDEQILEFYEYVSKNHIYEKRYAKSYLEQLYLHIKEPKFSDLVYILGFILGSGAWTDNADKLFGQGIPLNRLISNREDVYTYLYSQLNGKCCDNPSGQVYEIKEAVRKGRYTNNRMPDDIMELLLSCGVPEWYVDSMKKIRYLYSKAHIILLLKCDIMKYFNSKQNSKLNKQKV